jgi:hypothetical protein
VTLQALLTFITYLVWDFSYTGSGIVYAHARNRDF